MAAGNNRLVINSKDVSHLVVLAVAALLIVTALTTPWWTRGYIIDHDNDATAQETGEVPAFMDTFDVSYYPFVTPAFGPFQFDSIREIAVTVTGLAVAMCAIFVVAHNLSRLGIRTGHINASPGLPVKFAIAAFWLGIVGVGSALLWPFLGTNIEGIYGYEEFFTNTNAEGGDVTVVEQGAFMNIGFYLGFIAFVMYPAYLWINAHLVRQAQEDAAASGSEEGSPSY